MAAAISSGKYNANIGVLGVPSQDASLGLVYRLNYLWWKADRAALEGDMEKWNYILDRIFCNLLYRNDFLVVKTSDGKIKNIKLDPQDEDLLKVLNTKCDMAKRKISVAKTKNDYAISKTDLYNALMMKDIGLRKYMFKLGLYLKEYDYNPSKALFGGGFKGGL